MSKRARTRRPAPNAAHMARARAAMDDAANPRRAVHRPRPYRGELHRDAPVTTMTAQSSWGATTSEYLGDGFAVSSPRRVGTRRRKSLVVGDVVKAADRDNYGFVVAVEGKRVSVQFTNPDTGATAMVPLPSSILTVVRPTGHAANA